MHWHEPQGRSVCAMERQVQWIYRPVIGRSLSLGQCSVCHQRSFMALSYAAFVQIGVQLRWRFTS